MQESRLLCCLLSLHLMSLSSSDVCSEKLRLILATFAAGLLFPLLVWGGYVWLPFDSPLLQSAPLRVMYTLRCSFFAMIPILLGETSSCSRDAFVIL